MLSSIEALASAAARERDERQRSFEEWERDRNRLYQYMGRIASAQTRFYEVQADYYSRLEEVENRQVQAQEKMNQQQSQIIEILNRITSE